MGGDAAREPDLQTRALLCTLKPAITEDELAWLSALSPAEWHSVFIRSTAHAVSHFLSARLEALGLLERVGARWRRLLQLSHSENEQRYRRFYSELSSVKEDLGARGVSSILLKGAHIAELAHGDCALRPFGDLDILLRPEDVPRTEEVLLGRGYTTKDIKPFRERNSLHFGYCRQTPQGPLNLEVHWHVVPPPLSEHVSVGGFWRRAVSTSIRGQDFTVLSPEDLIFHICLHESYCHLHRAGLRNAYDLSALTRRLNGTLNWDDVVSRAHEWGVGKHVYLSLRLAGELLQAAVPEEVLADLRPDGFHEAVFDIVRKQVLGLVHRDEKAGPEQFARGSLPPGEGFEQLEAQLWPLVQGNRVYFPVAYPVTGTVEVRGRVVSESGSTVEGAEVKCHVFGGSHTTTSGKVGVFRCRVRRTARHLDVEAWTATASSLCQGTYYLTADSDLKDVVVTLYPLGGFSGVVCDGEGRPVRNARVSFIPIRCGINPDDVSRVGDYLPSSAKATHTTGPDGTFETNGLIAGVYRPECVRGRTTTFFPEIALARGEIQTGLVLTLT